MPSSHRRYAGWTIEHIREDARKIGPATAAPRANPWKAGNIPSRATAPVSASRAISSALSAPRASGAAAERAIEIGARTYGSVKSILDARLDRRPAPKRPADTAPILHPNIRGPRYHH